MRATPAGGNDGDRPAAPHIDPVTIYSKKGHALAAAIDAIAEWAHKWIEEEAPPARREHASRLRRRA
jgi:DNA-binding HxlR family transcriptional regulator